MFLKRIKQFQLNHFWILFKRFIKQPLYAFPTVKATIRCLAIAQKNYGHAHQSNRAPNAFRHALWNILIVRYCIKWKADENAAKLCARQITTVYENLFPNTPLAKAMDMHNNALGIQFFEDTKMFSEQALVVFLKEKTRFATAVKTIAEIDNNKNTLVYFK